MGTFIVRPTAIASGGVPVIDANGTIPNDYAGWSIDDYPTNQIIDALRAVANTFEFQFDVFADIIANSLTLTLRALFTGECIYLDGSSTPISFNNLPTGFTPSAASVKIATPGIGVPSDGTAHYYLQQDSGNNGTVDTPTYNYGVAPTMLDLVSNGCGLKCAVVVNDGTDAGDISGIYNLRVEGNYDQLSYSWTITPATSPLDIGDIVTVTSTNGGLNGIVTDIGGGVSGINLNAVDSSADPAINITINVPTANILTQTANLLRFTMPSLIVNPPPSPYTTTVIYRRRRIIIYLKALGNGVQFSGTVVIGTLPVLTTDGSGIYQLVVDKTADTLYARDGSTSDVKIPDPFGKVGFIGN